MRRSPARSLRLPIRGVLREIVTSARRLLRAPAYVVAMLACLGLGFAVLATTAAVADAFLLRPLPFPEPDRLVSIWKTFDREGSRGLPFFLKPKDARFLLDEARAQTDQMAVVRTAPVDVAGHGAPERIDAARTTAALDDLLGLRPVRGRFFDDEAESETTAVISDTWWQRRWGSDPAVLGSELLVDGEPHTIIGILPAARSYPHGVDVWLPLRPIDWESRYGVTVLARLAPQARLDHAGAEIEALGRRLVEINPTDNAGAGLETAPLLTALGTDRRPTLLGLAVAAGAFWLIALANATSLAVLRAIRRLGDAHVRVALGAGGLSLWRLALVELTLLVLASAGLGLACARFAVGLLEGKGWIDAYSFAPVAIHARVGGAIAVLAAITIVLLAAAYRATQGAAGASKGALGHAGSARAPRRRRALSLLVVADLAITTVLLVASWHAAARVQSMLDRNDGWRSEPVLTVGISASGAWAETQTQRTEFVHLVLDQAASLPGVTATAAVHALPTTEPATYWSYRFADRPEADTEARDVNLFRVFAGDYFRALGMPVVAGRTPRVSDGTEERRVVWVNVAFVERYGLEAEEAIGRPLISTRGGDPLEIVGVVGNVPETGLSEPTQPALYWPMAQFDRRWLSRMILVLRTQGPMEPVVDGLRHRVGEIDSRAVLHDVRWMDDVASASLDGQRLVRFLLLAFAILAVIQTVVGTYGLSGYEVASRRRELGLRFALGADASGLLRLVLRRNLRLALFGLVSGSAATLLAHHAMTALWQLGDLVPAAFVAAAMVLLGGCAAAALPAARRAARVDPAVSLRQE